MEADLAEGRFQTEVLSVPPETDLEVLASRVVQEGSLSLKRKQTLRHWIDEFSPEATT